MPRSNCHPIRAQQTSHIHKYHKGAIEQEALMTLENLHHLDLLHMVHWLKLAGHHKQHAKHDELPMFRLVQLEISTGIHHWVNPVTTDSAFSHKYLVNTYRYTYTTAVTCIRTLSRAPLHWHSWRFFLVVKIQKNMSSSKIMPILRRPCDQQGSEISIYSLRPSSLGLFCHVPLKRDT